MNMAPIREQEEWRRLIRQLPGSDETVPAPDCGNGSPFADAYARNRVGQVITRAVLGGPLYGLYRLYCGDPPPSGT